jgi:hypothetical protein
MVIVAASLSQHVYSVWAHWNIFLCQSNITFATATWSQVFLAYDIIIFDFGLFNYLLGTTECVANYLDGGYMRCLWCVLPECPPVLHACNAGHPPSRCVQVFRPHWIVPDHVRRAYIAASTASTVAARALSAQPKHLFIGVCLTVHGYSLCFTV